MVRVKKDIVPCYFYLKGFKKMSVKCITPWDVQPINKFKPVAYIIDSSSKTRT